MSKPTKCPWVGDMHVKREAKRLWTLLKPYHKGAPMPTIDLRVAPPHGQSQVGTAYYHSNRITVITNRDVVEVWLTLLHELTHIAVKSRDGRHHDGKFYNTMKDVTERRWKIDISYRDVTRWGYNVDALIKEQLREKGVVVFPPRLTKTTETQTMAA